MALEKGDYDKNGKWVHGGKGAYNHPPDHPLRRKVGYDEDDMKVGLSDTGSYMDDPHYMRGEDEYMKSHPIGNKSLYPHFHPDPTLNHLTNTHGGLRTENDVRADIRHGYNIVKSKSSTGSTWGTNPSNAENLGYQARQHFYIQREQEAAKKAAPPDRSAERSQQFMQSMQAKDDALFGKSEPSAPARTPAPKAKSSKPKPYRDPDDTFGAAVKHVVNKFRGK